MRITNHYWAIVLTLLALAGCNRRPTAVKHRSAQSYPTAFLEMQWTEAAAEQAAALARSSKGSEALPELRVYDGQGQLILHQFGMKPGAVGHMLDAALRQDRPIAGPSFAETLAAIETRDRQRSTSFLRPDGALTIFDYWASWCVPCKELEKELRAWTPRQRAGSVRVVRVEADWTKLERAKGNSVYQLVKGPNGKLIKSEMK